MNWYVIFFIGGFSALALFFIWYFGVQYPAVDRFYEVATCETLFEKIKTRQGTESPKVDADVRAWIAMECWK